MATQLKSVFSESGWQVRSGETGDPESGVVISVPDAKGAAIVKKALEDAGVHYSPIGGGGWGDGEGEVGSETIRLQP